MKTGRRIILQDGTVYQDSNCGFADGFLWCYISNRSIIEVAPVFFDPAATQTIIHEYGTMADTYEGYTEIRTLQARDNGCAVCLVKEGG